MAKSTRSRRQNKPAKPYPDFPLFPHATKRWAKKIRGKMYYFGPWDDPDGALRKYQEQRDDLHAGRKPRPAGSDAPTVCDLLNRFLIFKEQIRDEGGITPVTFVDYRASCERIKAAFGLNRRLDDLRSEDFEQFRAKLAKTLGQVALGNEIQRIRVVFKYAFDAGLIDTPVRFGPGFKRPSKKVLRQARAARGPRMFEAFEV